MSSKDKFDILQIKLLYHKYLYYIKNAPIISDYDYDMLERKSFKLAKELGYNANRFDDPKENEKHHVHWMVGFNENSKYWNKVKNKYKL